MIAVTGAFIVLSTFVGLKAGNSRCLASCVRKKRIRAGHELALVGPNFSKSYSCRNRSSLTGLSSQALWVRAWRKRTSRASSLSGVPLEVVMSWNKFYVLLTDGHYLIAVDVGDLHGALRRGVAFGLRRFAGVKRPDDGSVSVLTGHRANGQLSSVHCLCLRQTKRQFV